MNILVTGATGFIGRYLIAELAAQNKHTILALTRNPQKVKNDYPYCVCYVKGDITDSASLEGLSEKNIDALFHCAAYVENKPYDTLYRTNVEGTKNVCEFALKNRITRMVYTSSVAVISGNDQVPLTEDLPYKATNPYGESKIQAEKIVLDYRLKGLPVAILRPPMVYGEDEPHLLGLLLKLLKLRMLPFLNEGDQLFHLAYVKNVAAGLMYALDHEGFLDGAYFIGDEEVFSYKEVISCFCEGLGVRMPWHISKAISNLFDAIPVIKRKKDLLLKPRQYSLDKIKRLGFYPPFRARASLIATARNYQNS